MSSNNKWQDVGTLIKQAKCNTVTICIDLKLNNLKNRNFILYLFFKAYNFFLLPDIFAFPLHLVKEDILNR